MTTIVKLKLIKTTTTTTNTKKHFFDKPDMFLYFKFYIFLA